VIKKFQSTLGKAASLPLTAENNYATMSRCLQWNISLDRPYLPPQTASGSNQPFCHSALSDTDWQMR